MLPGLVLTGFTTFLFEAIDLDANWLPPIHVSKQFAQGDPAEALIQCLADFLFSLPPIFYRQLADKLGSEKK